MRVLGFILLLGIMSDISAQNKKSEIAVLGAGCFWCTEAIFSRVEGVTDVFPGYSGGHLKNPTYKEVCNSSTGHAEVVQVFFNPEEVTFTELLKIFWSIHDPTTLNRQGADVGTQYRSVIFYHSDAQKKAAIELKEELEKQKIWKDPIVTAIEKFSNFYRAEDYHEDYFANNPNQGYCRFVIAPKIEKFEKVFKDYLKTHE